MEVRYCEVDQVQIGTRLRSLDPDKVASLAESMAAIGLQQPISVWSDSIETLELVAGLHRLEAARKLGWVDIDCVFVNLDDIDRQLWEIDENLCRADLGPAEIAEHTAKRADLVRQKAEFIKLRKTESDPSKNAEKGQGDFDEETAKSTGKSKATVRRDKARGEAITPETLALVRGTDLDKGTYLDKLKKLSHDEQRAKVTGDLKSAEQRRKEEREQRKRNKARSDKRAKLLLEEMEREGVAGEAVAREIADILVNKLSEGEINTVYEALDHPGLTYWTLREAIIERGGGGRS